MSNDKIHAAVIEVAVDSSGVDTGVAKVEGSLARVGTAAAAAGKHASAGIDQIGKTAEATAGKIEESSKRSGRSIALMGKGAGAGGVEVVDNLKKIAKESEETAKQIESRARRLNSEIKRETVALQSYGKTASEAFSIKADAYGIPRHLVQAQIDGYAAMEKASTKVGISAKQTAWAMRSVPAQMTDIVVSLQGGQKPLTVLMQQGGQLKDLFGGVGNAAKAMGSYLAGIAPMALHPLTLIAASAVLLGKGAYDSAEQASALNKALISTGNIAGTSSGKLSALADEVGRASGQYGDAREAAEALAASGSVGAGHLKTAMEGVVAAAFVTGKSVKELVSDFKDLGKDPVKHVAEMNRQYHFLTIAIYDEIKALKEAGDVQGAADRASGAFADANKERMAAIIQDYGLVEKSWHNIKEAISGANAALMKFGKANKTKELAEEESNLATMQASNNPELKGYIAGSEGKIARLKEELRIKTEIAETESKSASEVAKYIAADLEKKPKERADTSIAKEASAYATLTASIRAKTEESKLELAVGVNANEAQKIRIKLDQDLLAGKIKLSAPHKAQIALDLQALEVSLKAQEAAKFYAAQAKEKYDASSKAIKAAEDEADKNEELARTFGLTKSAVEQLEIARLQDQLTQKKGIAQDTAETYALEAQIEAKKRSAAALSNIEGMEGIKKAGEELDKFFDPTKAQTFGDALKGAFNGAGDAMSKMTAILQEYDRKQKIVEKARSAAAIEYADDIEGLAEANSKINGIDVKEQIGAYGDMAGAAKGFFDEQSKGYKTLDGISKTFHTAQMAMQAVEMAQSAIAAILRAAAQTGWPGMIAMTAAVAALGYAVGGGFDSSSGDGTSAEERQKTQGTGTVLGDSSAKSESIGNALEFVSSNTADQLRYSSKMLNALNHIDASMSGLAQIIFRQVGITSGNNLGIFEGELSRGLDGLEGKIDNAVNNLVSKIPVIGGMLSSVGNALQGLWGKTSQSITDSGLSINGSMANLIGGSGVRQYVDVKKSSSSFFGLSKSTSYNTQYGGIDNALAVQFGKVFESISDSLKIAADGFGMDVAKVAQQISGYAVSIPKISLRGLTGQDLQDALNAVFSSAADNLANTIIPGLVELQEVGEGYFETLIRVSSTLENTNTWLSMFGQNLLSVSLNGAKAATYLADAFGGLEGFNEAAKDFYETYYTDGERAARSSADISKALAAVNMAMPDTKEAFRNLAASLDLSTESGREAYAMLLTIAPQFAETADAIAKLAKDAAESLMAAFTGRGQDVPALDSVSLNVAALNEQIRDLNLGAEASIIDFAGLSVALANVNTGSFMETIVSVFENLGQRIQSVLGGIANERIAVRSAALQILNPAAMTPDAIRSGITAISATAPSIGPVGSTAESAKSAQLAYSAALQEFAIEATKSVSKLTKLREETVKYYEAQKALAELMGNGATALRKSASDYQYSQFTPEQQLADLQGKFSSAYSMALSTDGSTLAGYGTKLNELLSPMLEKAKEVLSDSGYNALVATSLARVSSIADKLDALSPMNYAADSLDMLGQIDATLALLDESSRSAEQIISAAISAGADKTAAGLHAVVAALTGQIIPGFATGGDFAGGLRIVGENGPELEATGPSRIFNANQTRNMMGGSEMMAELRALREEVANLRAEARATASNTAKIVRQGDRMEVDGMLVRTEADTPLATVAA